MIILGSWVEWLHSLGFFSAQTHGMVNALLKISKDLIPNKKCRMFELSCGSSWLKITRNYVDIVKSGENRFVVEIVFVRISKQGVFTGKKYDLLYILIINHIFIL